MCFYRNSANDIKSPDRLIVSVPAMTYFLLIFFFLSRKNLKVVTEGSITRMDMTLTEEISIALKLQTLETAVPTLSSRGAVI